MALADYRIVYSGGMGGSGQAARTFADLGVVEANITSKAGGEEVAEITVDATLGTPGAALVPLARHDLYAPGHSQPVWSGWLMQPGRQATGAKHQQVFRLEGPSSLLASIPFQQPWSFPTEVTLGEGPGLASLASMDLSRFILNRGDTGIAAQIQEVWNWFASQVENAGGLALGSLDAIPTNVKPPEDEAEAIDCAEVISRETRWCPSVTAFWSFGNTPTLKFAARDAASAADIVLDPTDGTAESFRSTARFDLLVREFRIAIVGEQPAAGSGGQEFVALVCTEDVSTVENGSLRRVVGTIRLRGVSDLANAEAAYGGIAAALHKPFAKLSHTLTWAVVARDVNWTHTPGLAVVVQNTGDEPAAGVRSILQSISRDLKTGTTSYQAGPPAHLSMQDLQSLNRIFTRSLNTARAGNSQGGPGEQSYGFKDKKDKGTGTGTGTGTQDNGDCGRAHRASTSYADQFAGPCASATSVSQMFSLAAADISAPASALPIRFREMDTCEDDGNGGKTMKKRLFLCSEAY